MRGTRLQHTYSRAVLELKVGDPRNFVGDLQDYGPVGHLLDLAAYFILLFTGRQSEEVLPLVKQNFGLRLAA